MIIVEKGQEQEYFVLQNENKIGTIKTYKNSFHNRNFYLQLDLQSYDENIAEEIFLKLMKEIRCPMQVMLPSNDTERITFLEKGGFFCKRKCYEIEAERENYIGEGTQNVSILLVEKGCPAYKKSCELLYEYYAKTHESINPLTVDIAAFSQKLPAQVFCVQKDNEIIHAAFVEENEIAYVCSKDRDSFNAFIKNIVETLFTENESLFFECDDCDWAAMELCSLFDIEVEESYNTYIRDLPM